MLWAKLMIALNDAGKTIKDARILILGLAYKANVDDDRESPSYRLMEKLEGLGATVSYHDPYIPEVVDEHGKKWTGVALTDEVLESADCVVFTTAHSCFDVDHIVEKAKLVVDLKNMVKGVNIENRKVFKL